MGHYRGIVARDFAISRTVCTGGNGFAQYTKRGYLIVGLSADYAPLEFHTTIDGQDTIVGADVAMAKNLASSMGVKLQLKEMQFDALIGALKTHKVDMIISGMSETPDREKQVTFSKPYLEERQVVLIRKSDAKNITPLPISATPRWVPKSKPPKSS